MYGQYSSQSAPSKTTFLVKTTREKHVFDNPAHPWAHPFNPKDQSGFTQTDARNAGGNFYFKTFQDQTRILFSYRDDYPVATLFTHGRKRVYLLRSGKAYSVTTARHFSDTRQAVPSDAIRFDVPNVTNEFWNAQPDKTTHKANLTDIVSRLAASLEQYAKAKSAWSIEQAHQSAGQLAGQAKAYAKFFGLTVPKLPRVPKLDTERVTQARQRHAHLDATKDARRAAADAAALVKAQDQIAAWKQGDGMPAWSWNRLTRNAFLRVTQDAQTGFHSIETSQHVRVPIIGRTGAARLLRTLEALNAAGKTYHTNGHSEHIGEFTVTSFDGEVLRAGCHTILWPEVLTVADAVRMAEAKDLERQARTNDNGDVLAEPNTPQHS